MYVAVGSISARFRVDTTVTYRRKAFLELVTSSKSLLKLGDIALDGLRHVGCICHFVAWFKITGLRKGASFDDGSSKVPMR
jgi:hypothetical protein